MATDGPMAAGQLAVDGGGVRLKNPVVAGSGEHLIDPAGLRAAIDAGVGAVVMKSTNESPAAKEQLDRTDYVLLDAEWRPLPWDYAPPADASLLCRSGLSPIDFDAWLDLLRETDAYARARDCVTVASLIPADLDTGVGMIERMVAAGARVIELNIGAPHGGEAAPGAIALERDADRVRSMTAAVRPVVPGPLWVKLTGQSDDVAGLAAAAVDGGADAVGLMGRYMAFLPDPETMEPVLGTRAAFGGGWALPLTCHWLAAARARLGPDVPLIGTNGARSGLDVIRMVLAGACAVQMTSAAMAGGPAALARAVEDVAAYAEAKDIALADIVGHAADRIEKYSDRPLRREVWRDFVHPDAQGG